MDTNALLYLNRSTWTESSISRVLPLPCDDSRHVSIAEYIIPESCHRGCEVELDAFR